jgi:hypothetical protein
VINPARGVDQRLCQVGFADAGFADDHHVAPGVDPLTRRQLFRTCILKQRGDDSEAPG